MKLLDYGSYKKLHLTDTSPVHAKTRSSRPSINRRILGVAIDILFLAAATIIAATQTPVNCGSVSGRLVTVENTQGDQRDPSVSGKLAARTDTFSGRIRFHNFLIRANPGQIPANGPCAIDTLSNVAGSRLSLMRLRQTLVGGSLGLMV